MSEPSGLAGFMAVAAAGPAERVFRALDDQVQAEVGAIISTCTTFDMATALAWRVFTNQPEAYPLTEPKPVTPNLWTRRVLDERQVFVGNSLNDIRAVFPDHEVIRSLGCGSVVNLPVSLSGVFLGTVNLLHEPGHFSAKRLKRVAGLLPAAALAFASLKIADTVPAPGRSAVR